MFFPKDRTYKIWNGIISIILMYVTFVLTFELAFIEDSSLFFQISEYLTSIIFAFDIFFNFNASYYDQYGKLISSRKKIMVKYLKGWFFVDFISSFPIYLFTDDNGKESLIQSLKSIKILKYLKVVRFLRLLKFIKKYYPQKLKNRTHMHFTKFKNNIERFIEHLFIVLIFAHCFSCFFYGVPVKFSPEVNWVKIRNLQDKTPFEKYLFSLHWMIETMITVGFGENTFR
jgi:hypothetical protein